MAEPARSRRHVAAAWGVLALAAVAASAVALRFGDERASAYAAGCVATPASRSLGRLTLLSAAIALAFAAAACVLLRRCAGTKAQWIVTTLVAVAVVLVDAAALVGGSTCVDFFPGGPD